MPKRTNKERALVALIENKTIRDAAKACKLSEVTLYRYLKESEFVREYRTARRRTVESVIGRLQRAMDGAAQTLERNLHCENPAVEVRTAQIILENGIRGIELAGIFEKEELAAVDEAAEVLQKAGRSFGYWLEDHPDASIAEREKWLRRFAEGRGVDLTELAKLVGMELYDTAL